MLVIEPRNGLANRLRAIDSGIALAQKLNQQLVIDWVLNEYLNCKFMDLFEPIEGVVLNDGIRLRYPFNKHINLHFLYKSLRFNIAFDSLALRALANQEDLYDQTVNCKNIYITTGEFFFPSRREYFYFKPKPKITDLVEEMCRKIGSDFIGIHIRRTDNENSIASSPTALFIEKIKYLLDFNPHTKFFLATDSKEDEFVIKQVSPDNIYSYSKILDRNNEEGIQDALVDLLCLSRALIIYGSHYSSFSEAATYFSGNRLIVLKQ